MRYTRLGLLFLLLRVGAKVQIRDNDARGRGAVGGVLGRFTGWGGVEVRALVVCMCMCVCVCLCLFMCVCV